MVDLKKFVSWTKEYLQNDKGAAKENRNTAAENQGAGTRLAKMHISQNIKFMGMGLKDGKSLRNRWPNNFRMFFRSTSRIFASLNQDSLRNLPLNRIIEWFYCSVTRTVD
uniref:Uncharacterized protein n=1 Tax=Glossina austeni TaxID=7395 RepID=A0A1A9V1R4_GLOAU